MDELLDENLTPQKSMLHFHWWVILIWVIIFAIGYVFRIMHWPWNSILRVLGAGGFMAYSFSFLLLLPQKNTSIMVLNSISLLWIVFLFWGNFFNGGYPLNGQGLIVQGIAFVLLFLIHFISLYFIKKSRGRIKSA